MFIKKNTIFLGIISMLFVLFISGCQKNNTINNFTDIDTDNNIEQPMDNMEQASSSEQIIGGDKDEYGCLIAAGYSWCQSKEKCIRTWEEDCPSGQVNKDSKIIFEDLEWKTYSNNMLGYSLQYPTIVNIMGDDLDEHVEFVGPLSDNEWWPQVSVSHYSSSFYRPEADVSVAEWVKPFPEYTVGEEIDIAALDTVHYVQAKTPQAWAADHYYFIKDNQLYNITIIHSNDKQDWDLYDKMLNSFSFGD